jgi:hypothetical protein
MNLWAIFKLVIWSEWAIFVVLLMYFWDRPLEIELLSTINQRDSLETLYLVGCGSACL